MINTLKVKMKIKKSDKSYFHLNDRIFEVVRVVVKNSKINNFSILLPKECGRGANSICDFSIKEGTILDSFIDLI